MTGKEIVTRAKSLAGCKYWYGGKRELASKSLADRLRKENSKVWTDVYYNTALKDVDGITHVCDCSGLVCYAYGISDIGSYQLKEKYKAWRGVPKAGMIGWKSGHVGIFSADGWDSPIIEMRSQAYDYMAVRTYKQCGFTSVLYDSLIDYEETDPYKQIGWHKDGFGWWYRHTVGEGAGTYYHDCFTTVNGRYYCFDSQGYICELNRVSPDSKEGWLNG